MCVLIAMAMVKGLKLQGIWLIPDGTGRRRTSPMQLCKPGQTAKDVSDTICQSSLFGSKLEFVWHLGEAQVETYIVKSSQLVHNRLKHLMLRLNLYHVPTSTWCRLISISILSHPNSNSCGGQGQRPAIDHRSRISQWGRKKMLNAK